MTYLLCIWGFFGACFTSWPPGFGHHDIFSRRRDYYRRSIHVVSKVRPDVDDIMSILARHGVVLGHVVKYILIKHVYMSRHGLHLERFLQTVMETGVFY